MSLKLNPEKALIFRIVHVDNVPWILKHGLQSRNSPLQDPHYINVGNAELIDRRSRRKVPISPGGTLSDYVPFYFTPFSIMMYNIYTGYGGITRRANKDMVIFVSSIHRLSELGLPFVFTNQHAYSIDTDFFSSPDQLDQIDWPLLQSRIFKTSDEDPGRQVRYQAEALVYKEVPLHAIRAICCHGASVQEGLEK